MKIIGAFDREFKNKITGDLVRGTSLTFFDEQTGETKTFFVGDSTKVGYDPKQLAKISGKNVEISTDVKTFEGKSRVVLKKITEVA